MTYKVKLEYNWGFSASVPGLAKTNPTHPYPPITTIIGAIGEVIGKKYRLGESSSPQLLRSISGNLLLLTYRAINYVPVKYQDINKVIVVKPNKQITTDAPARGKTVTAPLTPDDPPILEVILALRSKEIQCCNKKITINPEILWSIHRTGSKESLVNVWSVEEIAGNIEVSGAGKIRTLHAFPLAYIEQIGSTSGLWEVMWQVDPYAPESWHETPAMSYSFGEALVPYMVPVKPEEPNKPCSMIVTPKPGILLLDLDGYKAIGRRVGNSGGK